MSSNKSDLIMCSTSIFRVLLPSILSCKTGDLICVLFEQFSIYTLGLFLGYFSPVVVRVKDLFQGK